MLNRLQSSRTKAKKCFSNSDNLLVISTIVSLTIAIIVSTIIKYTAKLDQKQIYYISLPGLVFMNLMKMMIVPLLVLSLISGLTSLNLKTGRKQGLFSIFYFLLTTFVAVCLGIILAFAIRPGAGKNVTFPFKTYEKVETVSAVAELFNNLFPDNIVRPAFQMFKQKFGNSSSAQKISYVNGTNYLGLIFISTFFGVVLNCIGSRGQIIVTIITVLNDLTMKMVKIILWYMPIGIFFLSLSTFLRLEISKHIADLIYFIIAVLTGLLIHILVILPFIYTIFVRKNPYALIKNMSKAMVVGFVTQSSSATIPVTMTCVDENLKIDKRVTRFMIPIGAIVNMNGTGLFQALSAIFIAQLSTKALLFTDVIVISMTSTLAAIGAATLPSGGLVTLVIVLSPVGLDTSYISLLYTCDWFLDRCRTSVNILGDAFGCGIIQSMCKEELENDININDHFMTNL